jgi:YD repeat-containing protein
VNRLTRKFVLTIAFLFSLGQTAPAQLLEDNNKDAVRVTVSINPDGSRTTYEYDNPNHRATATTNEADGKLRGKIRYEIDENGRFSSGVIYGSDGKFRFKSIYKYDAAGRLNEESHLNEKGGVINKLVYHYDTAGKSTGYSVYDASGKLIGNSSSPTPTQKTPGRIVH